MVIIVSASSCIEKPSHQNHKTVQSPLCIMKIYICFVEPFFMGSYELIICYNRTKLYNVVQLMGDGVNTMYEKINIPH